MMEANRLEKSEQIVGRDMKGRFTKGHAGNPFGQNGFTFHQELIDALENVSKREGFKNFAELIAERAVRYETVLIAVLKKIVPDKTEHSGEMTIKFTPEEMSARINRLQTFFTADN